MVPESDGSRACQVSVSSPRDSFLRFCRGLIPSPLVQSRSAAERPSPWSPRWGPHGVAAAVVQAVGGYGSENLELCREVGPRFGRGSLDNTSHPGSVRHRRSPRGFGGWPPVASELVRDWGVSALLEAEGRSHPRRVVPTVPARDPARRVWASLCLDARAFPAQIRRPLSWCGDRPFGAHLLSEDPGLRGCGKLVALGRLGLTAAGAGGAKGLLVSVFTTVRG